MIALMDLLHADDCASPGHLTLDCPADEKTIAGVTMWRSTTPNGVRRAHIDADGTIALTAVAVAAVAAHLQVLHRALAR